MYSVLNKLSEYTYFYMSKNITSYAFLLVFKTVESRQCIYKTGKFLSNITFSSDSILKAIQNLDILYYISMI